MKILRIDLSSHEYEIVERDDIEEWLGGTALGVRLLREEMNLSVDPLSENNVVVLAVGALTPAFPLASKTVAIFKSPLTGNLGESHAGGRSAFAISNAGYRAIVIKGKSHKPIYVVVENEKVHFRDARVIWNTADSLVVSRIIAEKEKGKGFRSIMRIGGAGVKKIRYSSVITETYRHFGRLGLGAVFGSKNLRALVVIGKGAKKIKNLVSYNQLYSELYETILKSDAMKKYHLLGTAVNILPLNGMRALPTRNLSSSTFEHADQISGEAFAEHNLGRRIACSHCPIACIHVATLRIPYENQPYFYRTIMISYDYEPIYSLGTMLGIKFREGILRLIHKTETLGLDAISVGVCLAWATEALQKGLITEDETLVKLEFGNAESYLQAMEYIYQQPNEFYVTLGLGVERASEKYGGRDFALSFGGNEMPGYHAGYATHIGYLIGLRHSHLDNAGYALDQKIKNYPEPEKLVDELVKEECWRQVLSSFGICFFARGIYTPELICRALSCIGYELSVDELTEFGRKTYLEKLRLKKEMGLNKPTIPRRILETETPHGKLSEDYLARALDYWWNRYVSSENF